MSISGSAALQDIRLRSVLKRQDAGEAVAPPNRPHFIPHLSARKYARQRERTKAVVVQMALSEFRSIAYEQS